MNVIVDTGPLYAFLNKNDQWHEWAGDQFGKLDPPFLTCEAVISETVFLLNGSEIDPTGLFELVTRGHLKVQPIFVTSKSQERIKTIIDDYLDLPASFADACLLHMYETQKDVQIFTLDSHFNIYRTSSDKTLNLISPH